ncbi:hypothetical protein M2164_000457 [Streptomyces sp. SAI-208]|nr:hypothetical protein [Streptomyces sp. SAI-208]
MISRAQRMDIVVFQPRGVTRQRIPGAAEGDTTRQIGFALNNTDPAAGYQTYDHPPVSDHSDHSPRHQTTAGRTVLTICTIADTAAGLLGLWIVLCLLDACIWTTCRHLSADRPRHCRADQPSLI